jgi:hypothetical protein
MSSTPDCAAPVGIQYSTEIAIRIDRLKDVLKARASGARITRNSVISVLLERGLTEIEQEFPELSGSKKKRTGASK